MVTNRDSEIFGGNPYNFTSENLSVNQHDRLSKAENSSIMEEAFYKRPGEQLTRGCYLGDNFNLVDKDDKSPAITQKGYVMTARSISETDPDPQDNR